MKCKLPFGKDCPLEEVIPLEKDIMVTDCKAAKCPWLQEDTTSCVGEMPNDSTDGTLTTD